MQSPLVNIINEVLSTEPMAVFGAQAIFRIFPSGNRLTYDLYLDQNFAYIN